MEMSVSSEMTFFTTKQQPEICPHLRTGSSAEDRGRIDTSEERTKQLVLPTSSYLAVCCTFTPLAPFIETTHWWRFLDVDNMAAQAEQKLMNTTYRGETLVLELRALCHRPPRATHDSGGTCAAWACWDR